MSLFFLVLSKPVLKFLPERIFVYTCLLFLPCLLITQAETWSLALVWVIVEWATCLPRLLVSLHPTFQQLFEYQGAVSWFLLIYWVMLPRTWSARTWSPTCMRFAGNLCSVLWLCLSPRCLPLLFPLYCLFASRQHCHRNEAFVKCQQHFRIMVSYSRNNSIYFTDF